VRALIALLLGLSVASCSPGASAPAATGSTGSVELTVYGAASLKGALDTAKPAYESSHPGTKLVVSTDSSAALETQIEQGAPADVFLSADTTNPQKLADHGLAEGSAVAFARNLLTIVVPIANPAGIRTPADLGRPGVRIVAAGDAVPITRYTAQLVVNLARLPGYPTDFEARYEANVVSQEDNVRGIVAKLELGEGDAGVVYRTDANASTKVSAIAVPDEANVPATYSGIVVKASRHPSAAAAFLGWLAGTDGGAILATFGFLPPGP
jgi:molybdate transport system substrate-binding protein